MKSIAGLFILMCVIVDDNSVSSATTFRRRQVLREETSIPAVSTTPETIESSTVRRRISRLSLPSNATSIRSDIADSFSCDGKAYGYYADVENDCQVFHVCLPVTYPDGKGQQFRWSFICPEDTTFNQEAFTCVRTDDMPFNCADSEQFYELNRYLGLRDEAPEELGSNALDANEGNDSKLRITERPQSTFTSATTTTTAKPSTSQHREMSRIPIYHRRHYTTLSTAAPQTESTTEDTSTPIAFTEVAKRRTNVNGQRPPPNSYENLFETTEFASTETPIQTTFQDYVSTEQEPVSRIVPDLIEVSESSDKPTGQTEAKITDDVIQNIKQLQNILPATIQERFLQNAPTRSSLSTIKDQRRKRFLFTADAIENRRRLFSRSNSNKN